LRLGRLPRFLGLLQLANLTRHRLPQCRLLGFGRCRLDPRFFSLGAQLIDLCLSFFRPFPEDDSLTSRLSGFL
jgi:hypothetical protein